MTDKNGRMLLFEEKKVMSEKNQGFDTGEDGGGNMHSFAR